MYCPQAKPEKKVPSLDELLDNRDYLGAITLLKWKLQGSRNDVRLTEWLAYAHYHHGEHDKVSKAAGRGVAAGPYISTCTSSLWPRNSDPLASRNRLKVICQPSSTAKIIEWPRTSVLRTCFLQALALYQELLRQDDPDPLYHTYSAACHYYMGLMQRAAESAQQVRWQRDMPCSSLQQGSAGHTLAGSTAHHSTSSYSVTE